MKELDKTLLIKNLKLILKDTSKVNEIVDKLLSIHNLTSNVTGLNPDQLQANLDKIHSETDSILSNASIINNQGQNKNAYVTVAATIEQSIYDKVALAAKHAKKTINKMLSEWLNLVINDPSVLKLTQVKRLDHTGHTYKRIACCIPKSMLDMLDARLAQVKLSRYQCIKDWANTLAAEVDKKIK